ncbi:MAG: MraY family glycosyltransferase [Pseudomonadota bacterium]
MLLARLAPSVGLMAVPGEHRKHQQATPVVGGIAIFLGLVLGLVWLTPEHLGLLPAMSVLVAVGVLDDRFTLNSVVRLAAQAVAAWLMIHFTGAELLNLGAIFSNTDLWLGGWSMALTIFASIGVINAVNMSDGLDGLAGSLVLIVLLSMLAIGSTETELVLVVVAAVSGFLVWNLRILRPRARMFMGDAGSTLLGLILVYLLIRGSQQPVNDFSPVTALWLLALPLIDTVAVLLVRPIRGQSPFSADRFHYHHLLQARGLEVNQTLCLVLALQVVLIVVALAMSNAGVAQRYQMMLFLACFVAYALYLWRVSGDQAEQS